MFDALPSDMQNTAYDSERRPALILVADSNSELEEVDMVEYAVWAAGVQMTVYPPEMRTSSKALAVLDAYLF